MKKTLIYITLAFSAFQVSAQDTLITERDTVITNTDKIEVDQVEVITNRCKKNKCCPKSKGNCSHRKNI